MTFSYWLGSAKIEPRVTGEGGKGSHRKTCQEPDSQNRVSTEIRVPGTDLLDRFQNGF